MNSLPKDPVMLLSVVNTNLRDYYKSLEEFCQDKNTDINAIKEKLAIIDYHYDDEKNQFV